MALVLGNGVCIRHGQGRLAIRKAFGIGRIFDCRHSFDRLPTRVLPHCVVNQSASRGSGNNDGSSAAACAARHQ